MVSIYVQPTSLAIDKYSAPDKERAQLLWVAHMNGLKAQAEEVVGREIMYAERNSRMAMPIITMRFVTDSTSITNLWTFSF